MSSCFIIMPLTTPDSLVHLYEKDDEHFAHVLNHLFVPAIKDAKFEPILPIAQGSDVIHAEIVKNLEAADLVLCDISSLNPNVFFELGCRTALNKPVCYVMDDLTKAIPFDTGIINHHSYDHRLFPWTLGAEINRLSAHIRASAERSEGKNKLWQYFGLQSVARASSKAEGNNQDRLDLLLMEVEAIKQRIDEQTSAAEQKGQNLFTSSWQPLSGGFFGNEATASGLNTYLPELSLVSPRNWDNVIKEAENDLGQIILLRRPDKSRSDVAHVKNVIENHIRELGELINTEPQTDRAAKARILQSRLRDILNRGGSEIHRTHAARPRSR